GSAVNAMVIESFCSASPESDAPAEQAVSSRLVAAVAVSSRLVAAVAATHVMMRGVFIVLLELSDRRGVVHQHSSIASVSDVLTWRSVHVRMLKTMEDRRSQARLFGQDRGQGVEGEASVGAGVLLLRTHLRGRR